MFGLESILPLIQSYGLWLLAPLAVIEGPIVTVIASYAARLGYLDLLSVYVVVNLADLIGDALLYGFGHGGVRWIPVRWRERIGLSADRLGALIEHFRVQGGRTLVIGKLTHSAGVGVLVAAGMARMPFGSFMWYNLLGTLPKSAFFMVIGYLLGYAYTQIDSYIFLVSVVLLILLIVAAIIWFMRKRLGKWT